MKKHCFLAFLFVLGFCWMCSGENLGELAKKEKARREDLARKGVKSRVYTSQDLADLKAQLAIQPSTAETTDEATKATEQTDATQTVESTSEGSTGETAAEQQLKDLQTQKEEEEADRKSVV